MGVISETVNCPSRGRDSLLMSAGDGAEISLFQGALDFRVFQKAFDFRRQAEFQPDNGVSDLLFLLFNLRQDNRGGVGVLAR